MTQKKFERGSAIIEFALLVSGLMLFSLGVADFSIAITKEIALSASAQAGVRYAAAEGNSNDIAGMTVAAIKAGYGINGLTVKPSIWCACTAGGSKVSCSTICNTYDLPAQYVQVQSTAFVPILFNFAGIPLNIPMNASATMRAR
jgi:hypothetical protein